MTVVSGSPVLPRVRVVVYWASTGFIAAAGAVSGTMDVFRVEPVFGVLVHLGYPPYFSAILGTWKVLGALALVAPGTPRAKEWAYAGMFMDYTAATASYLAIGEG